MRQPVVAVSPVGSPPAEAARSARSASSDRRSASRSRSLARTPNEQTATRATRPNRPRSTTPQVNATLEQPGTGPVPSGLPRHDCSSVSTAAAMTLVRLVCSSCSSGRLMPSRWITAGGTSSARVRRSDPAVVSSTESNRSSAASRRRVISSAASSRLSSGRQRAGVELQQLPEPFDRQRRVLPQGEHHQVLRVGQTRVAPAPADRAPPRCGRRPPGRNTPAGPAPRDPPAGRRVGWSVPPLSSCTKHVTPMIGAPTIGVRDTAANPTRGGPLHSARCIVSI